MAATLDNIIAQYPCYGYRIILIYISRIPQNGLLLVWAGILLELQCGDDGWPSRSPGLPRKQKRQFQPQLRVRLHRRGGAGVGMYIYIYTHTCLYVYMCIYIYIYANFHNSRSVSLGLCLHSKGYGSGVRALASEKETAYFQTGVIWWDHTKHAEARQFLQRLSMLR